MKHRSLAHYDVHSMPLTQIYSPLSVAVKLTKVHAITLLHICLQCMSGEGMEENGYYASFVVITLSTA